VPCAALISTGSPLDHSWSALGSRIPARFRLIIHNLLLDSMPLGRRHHRLEAIRDRSSSRRTTDHCRPLLLLATRYRPLATLCFCSVLVGFLFHNSRFCSIIICFQEEVPITG
jgi:hypothetical protein